MVTLLVLSVSTCNANELIDAYIREVKDTRVAIIADAKERLQQIDKDVRDAIEALATTNAKRVKPKNTAPSNKTFNSVQDRQNAITNAEQHIAKVKHLAELTKQLLLDAEAVQREPIGKTPLQLHENRLKVGSIGSLPSGTVIQVIDKTNLILLIPKLRRNTNDWDLIEENSNRIIWLTKISTSGIVDSAHIKFDKLFLVVGTKQYTNMLNTTNTVFLLEPIDIDQSVKAESVVKVSKVPETKQEANRSKWINTSYPNIINDSGKGRWVQTDNQTQKTTPLTEVNRTSEYVELSGFAAVSGGAFDVGRIYQQRMDMLKNNKWEWCANGHWEN